MITSTLRISFLVSSQPSHLPLLLTTCLLSLTDLQKFEFEFRTPTTFVVFLMFALFLFKVLLYAFMHLSLALPYSYLITNTSLSCLIPYLCGPPFQKFNNQYHNNIYNETPGNLFV
jgi:hypothetical protein